EPFHLADYIYSYSPDQRPARVTAWGDSIHGTCVPLTSNCCVTTGFYWTGGGVQEYAADHATTALFDSLNSGVLIFNYEGHANRLVLTHEYIYVELPLYTGIPAPFRWAWERYTNADRPFVMLGYACYISQFDLRSEPEVGDGIGERMVLAPNGGA